MAATDYATVVQQLYISYFGRPADTYGLQGFEAQLAALDTAGTLTTTQALSAYVQANPTSGVAKLVATFNTAPESVALYGTGNDILSISKFVNAIYNNVLHRDADTDGGTYWINAIMSGGLSKANAALAITQGALDNATTQGLIDAALVTKTAQAAADFTTSLDTIPKINAYSGDGPAAAARDLLKQVTSATDLTAFHSNVVDAINGLITPPSVTTVLTGNVDTLVGGAGNDVFVGTGLTVTGLDSIDGKGGNNTLNITDTNIKADGTAGTAGTDNAALSLLTVTNVQNLNLISVDTLRGNAADVSNWTGLTAANFTLKKVAADVAVTAAATTAVTVNDTITTAASTTVNGGSTVNVKATNGTAAVALNNSAKTITVNGAAGTKTVSITQTDASNAGTGQSAAVSVLDVNQGSATKASTITSVTIDGATSGTVSVVKSDALTTLVSNNSTDGVTVTAQAATRTLGLTLNGNTAGTYTDATATTVNVTSTGAANSGVTLSNAAATTVSFGGDKALSAVLTMGNAATVTVTGAGGVTADATGLAAAAVITATGSTGANTLTLGAGQTFTGGSGVSKITISADATKAITAGAGTSDEIILNNTAATFTANNTLAKVTGFEIVGTAAASTGTFDLSKFGTATKADVTAYSTAGNVIFSNGGVTQTLSLGANVTGANTVAVTQSTAAAASATSTLNLNVGTTKTNGINTANGTKEIATITVSSGASTAGHFVTGDVVSATVNGTVYSFTVGATTTDAAVTAGLAAAITAGGVVVTNPTATTVVLTSAVAGNAFTVSAATTDAQGTPATIAAVIGTANVIGTNAVDVSGYTNVNVTSSGKVSSTTGLPSVANAPNVVVLTDSALKTLTIAGTDSIQLSAANSVVNSITTTGIGKGLFADVTNVALATTGVTVVGGEGAIKFTDAGLAAGKVDTITAGGGDNVISITSATSGSATVTLGNGSNTVNLTALTGASTVTVGTGSNTVSVGTGQNIVTFGAHASTKVDVLNVGVATTANTYTTVTGLQHGDTINLDTGAHTAVFSGTGATAASAKITLNASTALFADYIAAASSGDGATAHGQISWFQFGGNTYIVDDQSASSAFVAGVDNVVKLTGLVDLAATGNVAVIAAHGVTL